MAEYAKKGKIQKSIKLLPKTTKSCIDFSSSDCESLSSEDTSSEISVKNMRKKKVKTSCNYNSSDDSTMSSVSSDSSEDDTSPSDVRRKSKSKSKKHTTKYVSSDSSAKNIKLTMLVLIRQQET